MSFVLLLFQTNVSNILVWVFVKLALIKQVCFCTLEKQIILNMIELHNSHKVSPDFLQLYNFQALDVKKS